MKVFRENPEQIFADLKRRNISEETAKNVIELDKIWRELIEEGNHLRAKRNRISREIGKLKKEKQNADKLLNEMSGIKERLLENETETKEALVNRDNVRMRVPNILADEVPVGNDEEGNLEIKQHGPKRNLKNVKSCLLYTSPSPRDQRGSRMASCA